MRGYVTTLVRVKSLFLWTFVPLFATLCKFIDRYILVLCKVIAV